MFVPLEVAVLLAIAIPTLRVAAKRFERRQIAKGEWATQGPKHPTKESRSKQMRLFDSPLAFDQIQGIVRPEDRTNDEQSQSPDPQPPAT